VLVRMQQRRGSRGCASNPANLAGHRATTETFCARPLAFGGAQTMVVQAPHTDRFYSGTNDARKATGRLHTSQPLEGHRMISASTIAAAARVIEYAAARPIVLSAGLLPPGKGVAEGAEAGNDRDGGTSGPVSSQPLP